MFKNIVSDFSLTLQFCVVVENLTSSSRILLNNNYSTLETGAGVLSEVEASSLHSKFQASLGFRVSPVSPEKHTKAAY